MIKLDILEIKEDLQDLENEVDSFCQEVGDDSCIQLESDIERLKVEMFEMKGDNKLLRMQLKECSEKLQEQQGYYDDDGNYVE